MSDEPSRAEQEQQAIQGIADYLRQENPQLDKFQAWTAALDVYRVQFSHEVLPPPEE